ncbi:MAG: glycosyltransferase family 2 protein [Ruminococcaceae bacterium]|nr:glycosyltransferase family 2 protein [Oscillospiraceae bacterium]
MITVLLATYNGEKYLSEQLDSLLKQSFNDFKILIRDDASTDLTWDIIAEYCEKYPDKVSAIKGEGTGSACRNFFKLVEATDDDYVMFCDQDDVWLPEKIEKTYSKMKELEAGNEGKPLLVHSDLKVVDGCLNVLSESFFEFQAISPERDKLNNLLVQNNVTGCTVMINREMLKLAKEAPDTCVMHDWWLGLLASAFGRSSYIKEPLMLYRQHGNNQVGAKKATGLTFIINKFKTRKNVKQNYLNLYSQAESLLKMYGDRLSEEQRETVEAVVSLRTASKWKKIKVIRKYDFRKNTVLRTVGQYFSI